MSVTVLPVFATSMLYSVVPASLILDFTVPGVWFERLMPAVFLRRLTRLTDVPLASRVFQSRFVAPPVIFSRGLAAVAPVVSKCSFWKFEMLCAEFVPLTFSLFSSPVAPGVPVPPLSAPLMVTPPFKLTMFFFVVAPSPPLTSPVTVVPVSVTSLPSAAVAP